MVDSGFDINAMAESRKDYEQQLKTFVDRAIKIKRNTGLKSFFSDAPTGVLEITSGTIIEPLPELEICTGPYLYAESESGEIKISLYGDKEKAERLLPYLTKSRVNAKIEEYFPEPISAADKRKSFRISIKIETEADLSRLEKCLENWCKKNRLSSIAAI